MERRTVPDVVAQFPVWKCAGFGLVVSSGLLLAWEQALKLHRCPLFPCQGWADGAGGMHALAFRNGVYENTKALNAGLTE